MELLYDRVRPQHMVVEESQSKQGQGFHRIFTIFGIRYQIIQSAQEQSRAFGSRAEENP